MLSDRAQRQVDRFLDAAEDAMARFEWAGVRENAEAVLALDPENADAVTFLAAADRALSSSAARQAALPQAPSGGTAGLDSRQDPTSFCEGRYEVRRLLGEGGKKRVYLAHDAKLDRDVAFALIKTEGLDDEGILRIKREAQAMGRLGDHPHIVAVHDIGEEPSAGSGQGGQPYLVSQLMPGGDVEGLIQRAENHRVPLEQALKIADEVCQALEHAHSQGIVHRDLKPGNVWLTADGTAKLGDFGLAVAMDRTRLTQAGMMVGTVHYMPPEQATGGQVTARSDLYALGAMLYELVCGRPPFVGDDAVAIIGQHLNTPPVTPSWHHPSCPPGLEALILRLLEKDPGKRPESASEVRLALAGARDRELGAGETEDGSATPTPSPSPIYRRVFVGRENELRQIERAFEGALGGNGALVAVVGEPGIGKTALCEQLATFVALRGGRTLVGHSYEEGSLSLPYLPFVEALRTYVLARPPEALKEELGSGAAEVARIVSEIRERMPVELRQPGDPEEDRWRLLQAVTGFLRSAATVQPLLLVLEDLHWADRGTLDLLLHVARNLAGARLLIMPTYRDVEVDRAHPLSGALAELRRLGEFGRVLLRGLTVDEVHRMINALQGQDVRWSLAEAVHRQTEGNPLFIQEVLRYLVEEGLIKREAGRWRRVGEEAPEMHIPEGLRDVIGKRLSRLSAECNRALSVAAVIGRDFGLDTLRLLDAAPSEEALLSALEEAVKVGVLEDQSRGANVRFRFAHAFFRQTLYEEIFTPRRLRLHQEVARALERQYAARLDEHAAELAEHFAQSGDPADLAKAVRYAELAARRAGTVYAYGEAVHHLEQALMAQEVLDPEDRAKRCDLLLALGEALGPAGDPKRVYEEIAPEALALAEALSDRPRAARSCRVALEDGLERYGGGAVTAAPLSQEWFDRLDRYAGEATVERVLVDLHIADRMSQSSQWGEGRARRAEALRLARELGDPEALFRAVSASLLRGPPYHQEVWRLADEFTHRPRDGVSTRTLAQTLRAGHIASLEAGDRPRAEELWRELDDLAARARDPDVLLWPLHLKAIEATLDGELERAVEEAERVAARGEELGSLVVGRLDADFLAFWPLIYLGRAEEALAGISAAPQMVGRRRTNLRVGRIPLSLAVAGRVDEAGTQLGELLTQLRVAEDEDVFGFILGEMLASAVTLGARDAAALLAGRLEGITAVGTMTHGVLNVGRLLGEARTLLGEKDGAMADFRRGLEWATSIRFRPEVALTRLGIAELLLDEAVSHQRSAVSDGEGQAHLIADRVKGEALAHLDFAIGELRAMKMQPALERALRHKGLLRA